jgi:3-hydroxyisobutyrate dehydrogenase-like beta-hydroxyacid dehydrogenase
MEIGFIGLGKMGFPMARRLIEAGHAVTVYDTRKEPIEGLVALGAQAAGSVRRWRDRMGAGPAGAGLRRAARA